MRSRSGAPSADSDSFRHDYSRQFSFFISELDKRLIARTKMTDHWSKILWWTQSDRQAIISCRVSEKKHDANGRWGSLPLSYHIPDWSIIKLPVCNLLNAAIKYCFDHLKGHSINHVDFINVLSENPAKSKQTRHQEDYPKANVAPPHPGSMSSWSDKKNAHLLLLIIHGQPLVATSCPTKSDCVLRYNLGQKVRRIAPPRSFCIKLIKSCSLYKPQRSVSSGVIRLKKYPW